MTDIDFLIAENAKKPVKPPPTSISQWVEGYRIMPPNTPFPGAWEGSRNAYLTEIQDNMAQYSPVQRTSIMKGVQLGLTASAENVIGFYMDANPTEILYVSADEDLLELWSTMRLDPLIDSIGMRDRIGVQTENLKSKRSGDKVLQKEFVGGSISMASARSASGLRSQSKRVLVIDEVDGPPRLLTTGEGTWLDVVYARADAWGARKKIMEFSTPSTFEDSLIRECYEAGDRRVFKVPCPRCGVMDVLEFENLRNEMRGGQLYQVWYECPHCNGVIQNYEKTWMMAHAEWVPTAIATSRGHRSYHISSMYSPVGMLSWFEMYQKFLEAKDKPGGMRSFCNLYLGLPYKEKGSRPKLEKVIELRGEYREGEVPAPVLFITAGVDVQQGSATDSENPPRLEMEIVGWGAGYRSWSLLYKVFPGAIDNAHAGAWEDMHQWALKGGLSLKRADGVAFPASLIFIDAGDGTSYNIVYDFTARWSQCFPSKGFSALRKQKHEKGDEAGPHNFKRWRRAKSEKSGGCRVLRDQYELLQDGSVFQFKNRTPRLRAPEASVL